MEEITHKKRTEYQSKYTLIPKFKLGIHTGKVIVANVGKQKKEIVDHGDVLNTTGRIKGKYNELEQKLLVSVYILPYLKRAGRKGKRLNSTYR